MMSDIKEGLIQTVIVYKLDRISRSILDFSNMMDIFSKYNVQFISATEKFDTSSPMGNAMLNICIVFAQLERETIQKRVADAYYSRSRKSLFMGGPIPYGFRKVPAVIEGIHTSMYEAVPEEAKIIRLIYEMYSQPDTSSGDIIRRLNDLGIKKRGVNWTRSRIREIIANPIYVKADIDIYNFFIRNGAYVADNPSEFIGENGCYSYKSRSEKKKDNAAVTGNHIVIAPHKGIIDSGIWLKCHEKCIAQKQVIPSQKARNSWLCGKIRCGKCGYAMIVKRYNARRHRYLFCSNKLDSKSCIGAGTLYADVIEQIVYNEMRKKLEKFPKLSHNECFAPDKELTALEIELAETDREVDCFLERVRDCDDALFRRINEMVNSLDKHRSEIEERIMLLKSKKNDTADEIEEHLTKWEELSFSDKRKVVNTLIRVIYLTNRSIIIQWRI